jgi:hypothetical protein
VMLGGEEEAATQGGEAPRVAGHGAGREGGDDVGHGARRGGAAPAVALRCGEGRRQPRHR